MKINENGLQIIKDCEGLYRKAYRCPAGFLTTGYGHTGRDVTENQVITEEIAKQLIKRDISRFEDGVSDLLKVETSSNEFSAMVSLAFNIGLGNFAKSEVLENHNKNKKYDACLKFHNWRRGGGKILKGLVLRRLKEAELYIR